MVLRGGGVTDFGFWGIGRGFGEFQVDQETIFERIARGSSKATSLVVDNNGGSGNGWLGSKVKTLINCSNDSEVRFFLFFWEKRED